MQEDRSKSDAHATRFLKRTQARFNLSSFLEYTPRQGSCLRTTWRLKRMASCRNIFRTALIPTELTTSFGKDFVLSLCIDYNAYILSGGAWASQH